MKIVLLLGSLFLCACSQKGFVAEEFRASPEAPLQIDNGEVERILAKRPQLPKPFRLGVYFQQPRITGVDPGIATRWSPAEREKVFQALEAIPRGEVSALFTVSAVETENPEAIRVAAARQGAHAVLVVSAKGESVVGVNGLALGYLLVAPIFFLHGNDLESLFQIRASLWDVRNEFLYLTAEGEGASKRSRPAVGMEADRLLGEVRADALKELCAEIGRQVGLFSAKKSEPTAL